MKCVVLQCLACLVIFREKKKFLQEVQPSQLMSGKWPMIITAM